MKINLFLGASSCSCTHIPSLVGEAPSDKQVLHLLAFCTNECIDCIGTDELDKMLASNHTLKYSDCNMLLDYLHAAGYKCSKVECRQISSDHIAKMDCWIEAGLVGEGNDWKLL